MDSNFGTIIYNKSFGDFEKNKNLIVVWNNLNDRLLFQEGFKVFKEERSH